MTTTTTNETTIYDEALGAFTTVRAPAVPCKCRRYALPYAGAFVVDSRGIHHTASGCGEVKPLTLTEKNRALAETIRCPRCGAAVGAKCVGDENQGNWNLTVRGYHARRFIDADKAQRETQRPPSLGVFKGTKR